MSVATETFRDSVGTISKEGTRNWIYPKKPKGNLYHARSIISYLYLSIFFILPWIKTDDHPLFMFNVIERKFILFGMIFWPQDFFLFVIGMLTFMVFIVLFTVIYGRIFCGWICPQTIFMEMVFRKIEYFFEGDSDKQRKLNAGKWNAEKILRKGAKLSSFFLVSFIIANYFLAYIIGMDKVISYASEGVAAHMATFFTLILFTSVFFFVYAWFREQACLIVCPYGRLQGVMLDPNSIVVAYDHVRGEPRDKFKKVQKENTGDCVDCMECVKVCPTGIDTRNGTQLECINCTSCIDACNSIMDKFNRDRGLIRYASENNIRENKKLRINSRMVGYSAVLLILAGILAFLLSTRKDIQTTVMRAQGVLYQNHPNGEVSNLYNIKLINKTHRDIPVDIKLLSENGRIVQVGKNLIVKKESAGDGVFFIYLNKKYLKNRKNKIRIGVFHKNGKKIDEVSTTFLSPSK